MALEEGCLDFENIFTSEISKNLKILKTKWINWTGLENLNFERVGLGFSK